MTPTMQAFLFGLLAAFFSGTHSVIVRYLADHIHGTTVAVFRLYIAAVVIFAILKLYKKPIAINWTDRTLLITVIGFSANYVVFHWGLEYVGASSAMVLENTAPIFVLVISVLLLRDRIRMPEVIATFLAVFGVYFTVSGDFEFGPNSILGDEFELLAGLTWAVFIMGMSRAMATSANTFDRLCFLMGVICLSAIILTPFLFIYSLSLSPKDIILLVLLGVFPTAIAYYLWYEAAARVSAMTTSLLFTLTVVFTFINAYLFIGEEITVDMLIGAALIVASVLLSKIPTKKA